MLRAEIFGRIILVSGASPLTRSLKTEYYSSELYCRREPSSARHDVQRNVAIRRSKCQVATGGGVDLLQVQ